MGGAAAGAGREDHRVNRRQFLALGGAAATAMVLDPERLLWVPGARTFFLPSPEIVTAQTMEDALGLGLVAVFPDGARLTVRLGGPQSLTLNERYQAEVRAIEQMGGRVVANRQWVEHR